MDVDQVAAGVDLVATDAGQVSADAGQVAPGVDLAARNAGQVSADVDQVAPDAGEAVVDQPAAPGAGPPPDPEVAALCMPFSDEDPCGPDLDMEGDANYLNFFANVEGVLPTSFFSPKDGTPFDRSTVDLDGQLDAMKPLLDRTRDVRLLILRARLAILNKDLGGFALNLAATAWWLDKFWDAVHPQPQLGDSPRSSAIATLELPTVIFPLQYAPLVEAHRLGSISYRTWMIASGEVKPRDNEIQLSQAAVSDAIGAAEPVVLAKTRRNIALVKTSLEGIRNAFYKNSDSAGLEKLLALTTTIREFIDPQASAAEAVDLAPSGDAVAAAGAAPASPAEVSAALAAIADYYGHSEPSSPILLLVQQAHQLIGKSFFEVISILVPGYVDKAAFQIGGDQFFPLPLQKLSSFARGAAVPGDGQAESAPGDAAPRYTVTSRTQAIVLLDQIQQYFRRTEPSSPVPMLCERARALAERDFMGVLRDVLPKEALKSISPDKAK